MAPRRYTRCRRGGLLVPGTLAVLSVAYVAVPALDVRSARHRYTCRKADAEGGCYLYEGPFLAFSAELPGDADGLVLDYPEIFQRIA